MKNRAGDFIRCFIVFSGTCLVATGCSGITGSAPVAVASLDGIYRGEMVQKTGRPSYCTPRVILTLTLQRGEARGELTSVDQAGLSVGSFYAFVEQDGRVRTTARIGTQMLSVDGRFSGQDFRASAENQSCSMTATARRGDGS